MPNTIADNVEYSTGLSVKQKIQAIEQGGGGSVTIDGVPYTNLFDANDIVAGKGVVYDTGGAIRENGLYSCVFIPLEFGKYYSLTCDWKSKSLTAGGFNFALAKGSVSNFSNLLVSDFVDGADWLTKESTFSKQTNVHVSTGYNSPSSFTFKAPSASDFTDNNLSLGIVINTSFNNVSVADILLFTQSLYPVEYQGIKGKNVAFFGDSITQGTDGGFVGLVKSKSWLNIAANYGSSGAATPRLASIMLGNPFRESTNVSYKDYMKYQAVVIQIGTNGGVSGNIDNDIPDIGIYDISDYPYEYSASGKTIASATVNEPIEFFTKCFANTYYGNVALCIEYVRYINPNCRIFLTTIPHNIGFANFDTVRNAILNLTAKMGVQVLDAGAYAGLGVWNITDWCRDTGSSKTHFNEKGNEMWAAYLANELDKKFYETDP